MYEIAISDEQHVLEIDADLLRQTAIAVLTEEQANRSEIGIALVDSETMRTLNRQHLDHDYDTDVLSFLLECQSPKITDSAAPRGSGKRLEGEIVISVPMAIQTAPRFNWSPHSEILLYLVHGLLHLMGYDDQTSDELEVMRNRERELLSTCGLKVIYEPPDTEQTTAEQGSADR